ncbi:MAG: DUF2188 domain-containing protein [Candidatus Peribacteraceae bacterium]|nr:DUF2188 domain-containing protein [Candidatus Peribacteraceae bacterium]
MNNAIKRIHIISRRQGWAVKKEGALRAMKIFKDRSVAISSALELAWKGFDIIKHKKDGTVEWIYEGSKLI